MSDLIEALQILLKYGNPRNPTHCEHDVLIVVDISPNKVSKEDMKRLKALGFDEDDEYGDPVFKSYRFGSA